MKKLLALVFCLGFWSVAHAQMQKGSWMVDGQVALSSNNQDNESTDASWKYTTSDHSNQFTLSPGMGYFIQDNFALGLSPVFTTGWGKGQSGENDTVRGSSFGYGIGVFSRRYLPAGEKLSFYGDLRVGGIWGNSGWHKSGSSDRTVLSKSRGFEGTASLGLQYLVTDYLGIHLQSVLIDYQKTTQTGVEYESSSINSSLNARLFSSFQIGATVFF